MMTVSFNTDPVLSVGKPRLLFTGKFLSSDPMAQTYDLSSDGKKFLMIRNIEPELKITHINVIHNWIEELKTKVK